MIPVHPAGAFIGILILVLITATIYWMLHPPSSKADIVAERAEQALEEMVGSIIVVFSEDIHSEHMMVLAARLARREKAELLAVYVIEVPLILPQGAHMPEEDRVGYEALATAEVIAQHNGVHIRADLMHARQVAPAVVDLAKRESANLIVLGSYREGKYTGAPMGRSIEVIAAQATCDVLIGIQGNKGKILTPPTVELREKRPTTTPSAT